MTSRRIPGPRTSTATRCDDLADACSLIESMGRLRAEEELEDAEAAAQDWRANRGRVRASRSASHLVGRALAYTRDTLSFGNA